ncbi:mediator of RNA polymerase II transcription subunit 27-like isoform X2 [Mercenaria mercenaria]|uniref:mediator of RNA polymerase II transcription subunit 27-like isoform X2 n=1 Tax=Mercenaria mercenaria TaxID=6596 RepID=UPI00234EB7FF|nr:mediator of RNA polymerase II transcription subunit 27-like isoform X2 [Mercenaria mercenaria]
MTENQTENIIQTIKLTQKLRASVAHVFQNLGDGCSVAKGNEKQILNTFHESLLDVNNDFSELEKACGSLQSLSSVIPNSIYLSIDPAIDKSPVYTQIFQAYKWSNKVSDLAGYGASVLDAHVKIKRTQQMGAAQAKKLKRTPPTGHAYGPSIVENYAARFNQKAGGLSVQVTRPLGSHAVLQVTLGHILKAQVALRGLMIEWVNVRGYTEENPDESKLELWSKSKYLVFQKVTESATAATLHFYSPHNAELSLTSFMHWFQRYRTLFSASCQKCGKHYLNGLPPTWRDLRTTEPYHDVCRQ